MIVTSLSSGSSGNASFLESDGHILLVDCGLSAKRIAEAVKALGFSMSDVDGLLLTHEHTDHIKGLKRLMSAYGIPVYTSKGTAEGTAAALRGDYFSYAGKELIHPHEIHRQVMHVAVFPQHVPHHLAAQVKHQEGHRTDAVFPEVKKVLQNSPFVCINIRFAVFLCILPFLSKPSVSRQASASS